MQSQEEQRLLAGWGYSSPSRASCVDLSSEQRLVEVMSNPPDRGVIARGLGRAYGDAAQNAGGQVVMMEGLKRIQRFDAQAGTVTVDAGLSLAELVAFTLPQGWFIGSTPGTKHVTVGGAIAADVHGKNHHHDGGFSSYLNSLVLCLPGGSLLECSREQNSDAFWATVGGMGLTGIILQAQLQLIPVETARIKTVTQRIDDLDQLMATMRETDSDYRYSVAWIDCMATGKGFGRGELIRGDHATLGELEADAQRDPLLYRSPKQWSVVPNRLPNWLLNSATIRTFNAAKFAVSPKAAREAISSIDSFFYPLDAISGWNRLYGPRGFIQYQFVVPFGQEASLQRILELLQESHVPIFLAVLKQFADQEGMISFPSSGWTLAVDMPTGIDGLNLLLDRCDLLVAEAGGRIYFAKDSRLKPELVESMYPRLAQWREVCASLDPDQVMQSDLARRLNLL